MRICSGWIPAAWSSKSFTFAGTRGQQFNLQSPEKRTRTVMESAAHRRRVVWVRIISPGVQNMSPRDRSTRRGVAAARPACARIAGSSRAFIIYRCTLGFFAREVHERSEWTKTSRGMSYEAFEQQLKTEFACDERFGGVSGCSIHGSE